MSHKFNRNLRNQVRSTLSVPKHPSSLEKKLKASEKVMCRKSRPHRRFCGHCGELLSLKTYRRHYKKYCNTGSGSSTIIACEVTPNASFIEDLPGMCITII